MNLVNAIAKVRFGSVKAQRVQIHKGKALLVELLCMEPGQDVRGDSGEWRDYVITGTAEVASGGSGRSLSTGHFAAAGADEPHTVANAGEGRLICLAISRAD